MALFIAVTLPAKATLVSQIENPSRVADRPPLAPTRAGISVPGTGQSLPSRHVLLAEHACAFVNDVS